MGPGPTAVIFVGLWPDVRASKARGVCEQGPSPREIFDSVMLNGGF